MTEIFAIFAVKNQLARVLSISCWQEVEKVEHIVLKLWKLTISRKSIEQTVEIFAISTTTNGIVLIHIIPWGYVIELHMEITLSLCLYSNIDFQLR